MTVENRAQGLYGLRFDYYARGENVGGQVVMPAGQAFANGENITLTLEKRCSRKGGWGRFGLAVFALCGDGSEILLDDYWQWSAQMGGTYHFVLDGSEETGFTCQRWRHGSMAAPVARAAGRDEAGGAGARLSFQQRRKRKWNERRTGKNGCYPAISLALPCFTP